MDVADSILAYLDSVIATVDYQPAATGGNAYAGWLPDQPDTALKVTVYGGERQPGDTAHGYSTPTLQVWVRGATRAEGIALADAAYQALEGLSRVDLPGGVHLILCRGLQAGPVDVGRDRQDRPEWSINFAAEVRNPTTHRQ